MKANEQTGKFVCEICESEFTKKGLFKMHKLQCKKCVYCGNQFSKRGYVLKHMKKCQTKEHNKTCDICEKEFQSESELKEHNKNCKKCVHCLKEYADHAYLKKHIQTCKDIYLLSKKNKEFPSTSTQSQEDPTIRKRKGMNLSPDVVKRQKLSRWCTKCKETFCSGKEFYLHRMSQHGGSDDWHDFDHNFGEEGWKFAEGL